MPALCGHPDTRPMKIFCGGYDNYYLYHPHPTLSPSAYAQGYGGLRKGEGFESVLRRDSLSPTWERDGVRG